MTPSSTPGAAGPRWPALPHAGTDRRGDLGARLLRRHLRSPDPELLRRLVAWHQPLVASIVRSYHRLGEPPEDLAQVGNVGLLAAIRRYDASRGGAFVAFAAPTIRGEIQRHFRDHTRPVHLPRPVQEAEYRTRRAREQLLRESASTPSDALVAARANVSLVAAREAKRARLVLGADPLHEISRGGREPGEHDPGIAAAEARVFVWQTTRGLSDRDRRVLYLTHALGLRQREIAELEGVSQVHVSRILAGAHQRLRAIHGRAADGYAGVQDASGPARRRRPAPGAE